LVACAPCPQHRTTTGLLTFDCSYKLETKDFNFVFWLNIDCRHKLRYFERTNVRDTNASQPRTTNASRSITKLDRFPTRNAT